MDCSDCGVGVRPGLGSCRLDVGGASKNGNVWRSQSTDNTRRSDSSLLQQKSSVDNTDWGISRSDLALWLWLERHLGGTGHFPGSPLPTSSLPVLEALAVPLRRSKGGGIICGTMPSNSHPDNTPS